MLVKLAVQGLVLLLRIPVRQVLLVSYGLDVLLQEVDPLLLDLGRRLSFGHGGRQAAVVPARALALLFHALLARLLQTIPDLLLLHVLVLLVVLLLFVVLILIVSVVELVVLLVLIVLVIIVTVVVIAIIIIIIIIRHVVVVVVLLGRCLNELLLV